MEPRLQRCPEADVAATTLYRRVLHRACQLLGGIHQLAVHLGVRDNILEQWLDGRRDVPEHVFLKALDIVVSQPR
jgi:hypothetical protein